MTSSNGINMLDVKKNNRSSLLHLVYHSDGISRKAIAARLGLTPAAITLIVNDMLAEGLLAETQMGTGPVKKGRKEVALTIPKSAYAVIGVYISQRRYRITCMDLAMHELFSCMTFTADFHRNTEALLAAIAEDIRIQLENRKIADNYHLIGMGVSTHGIVDTVRGISINSYHILDSNTPIADYFQNIFHIPVLLMNNICALTHAENFLSASTEAEENILLIKYGPGVGAAQALGPAAAPAIRDIQIGHMIVDPCGAACPCGSNGCLETIVSYDAIEHTLHHVINRHNAPALWEFCGGDANRINLEMILRAYSAGDSIVERMYDRVIMYLGLAVNNASRLFSPKKIILYGQSFDNEHFRQSFFRELTGKYQISDVSISQFNLKLDVQAPATAAISAFLDNGGYIPTADVPQEQA